MQSSGNQTADMMTLARLHAALDSVLETEALLAQITASLAVPRPTVARVEGLLAEARDALRSLLGRQRSVQAAVGLAITPGRDGLL